jgi:hypothetical protein
MVPEAGLEPARYFYRGILSPLCLPIPPLGQVNRYHFLHYTFLNLNVFKLMEAEAGIEPA